MAQVLKEEVRDKIMDAAKQELLTYGFNAASMRRIAKSSGITVGNIYRYFKNKDDINRQILYETLSEINHLIMNTTSNNLTMESKDFSLPVDVNELRMLLSSLCDELVEIAFKRKIEFKILMQHSSLNEEIVEWFKDLIKYFITKKYQLESAEAKVDLISRCYASAIIAGFKECLDNCRDKATCKQLTKAFMLSYVNMLDNDLDKFI